MEHYTASGLSSRNGAYVDRTLQVGGFLHMSKRNTTASGLSSRNGAHVRRQNTAAGGLSSRNGAYL